MLSIPGYTITETLYSGSKTVVYRGYREQDHYPFIFKTLSDDYPLPKDLSRLQHEYALTHAWDEPGLVRSHALIPYQNTQILLLQDIGGITIKQLLENQPTHRLSPSQFLPLAIRVAQHLGRIHQRHLIHKDINPSNIVVNMHTGESQIIDFGIATQLSRETPQLQNPGHLEGTLPYLSPEQTGRMNRALDYRTDFYSLGATFYEMLAGTPPFSATDPMKLVHFHLASSPKPLHERDPDIPPMLSALVQKLLEKTAEARYQSSFGLIADLDTCLQNYTNNIINEFTLGKQDISERFQIPQKLYGRETEVAQVLNAFARISQGHTEILLVAGYSGVGKTVLVHEVHKPITEKNGYFIQGKFDQFQRDIPYASLIQAFQELVRQLLTESQVQITRWKTMLELALGSIAQVIIEVIPELESIMGPQSPAPPLPPTQAENRFNMAFLQFISTFATKEHPLVLFLDDVQWADLPSLQMIRLFTANTRHLLLIAAYRDNEVEAGHPLMLLLNDIGKTKNKIHTVSLKPLDLIHIQQLLADSLHYDLAASPSELFELTQLAELCLVKTQGNPFFLGQFLRTLTESEQIRFDHAKGRWCWEIEQLKQTPITNNVVDLMAAKIKTLPRKAQAAIRLAACVGNHFNLTTLAWASELSTTGTAQALWPALQANLIIPLDDAWKYLISEDQNKPSANSGTTSANPSFKFVHDRVQQAAYSLIDEDSKTVVHLRIGRRLLAHLTPEEHTERLFDLVYHWNKGRSLLTQPNEKIALAELNLMAGKKAKSSAAHLPALHYFQIGLQQLHDIPDTPSNTPLNAVNTSDAWSKHYDLCLALSVAATEAAFLGGKFEEMDDLASIVLKKAKTLIEQVPIYQIQIQACILKNQSLEAIRIALPVLQRLGVKLPKKPNTLDVLRGVVKIKLALIGKPVESLLELPHMRDPLAIAAMQILSSIGSAAYFAEPQLFPLIFFKQIHLSMQHGNYPLSAHAYSGYAVILCGVLGDIEAGYRFGNLALELLERFPDTMHMAKVGLMVEAFVKHWKEPFHERPDFCLAVYRTGAQTGDLEYAAYAAFTYCHYLYFMGKELKHVHQELEKYTQVIIRFKQEPTLYWQRIAGQAVANLLGQSDDPCRLIGNSYNEDTDIITADNRSAQFFFHCHKLILFYLFEKYPQALEQANAAERNLDAIVANLTIPVCHVYMALVRLALFAHASKKEQKESLKKVDAIRKKLKQWAFHAPANHLHQWHLVEAERARVTGNDTAAITHYEKAIDLAKKYGFRQDVALTNELAARFHLLKGQENFAKICLREAHHIYHQWGAIAKTQHLEQQYSELLGRPNKRTGGITLSTNTSHSTDTLNSGALDLATVIKASQAISGEIVLGNLLKKLMYFGIENAGAQRAALLLETKDEWRIEAQGRLLSDPTRTEVSVLRSLPLEAGTQGNDNQEQEQGLPVSLIQYVTRTQKPLVLNHACGQGHFMNDPYIIRNQTKSILCAPILRQGKPAGMLYLENNLIEGAFTADRLEVLKILSYQAAISIENARIYENLESTVAQRTAALSQSNAALSTSNHALSSAYGEAEKARRQAENAEQQATQALADLRAAQSQLVQSAKMASLGHLVAGVAHELNTPIGNALTTASVLTDANHELKAALQKGDIRKSVLDDFIDNAILMTDVVNRSCLRAATLINSFKQVAADQTSEQRRLFELHALVEDNIAALRASLKNETWVIKTTIPSHIQCDSYPGPLGQIIANLVHNAAIHAFAKRTSGTLHITAAIIDPLHIEMAFEDDGHGIDEAVLPHIFEPFYTTRLGQGGPGLGLSISLNIATGVLGGTLNASSAPNAGARFSLIFPHHAQQAKQTDTNTY